MLFPVDNGTSALSQNYILSIYFLPSLPAQSLFSIHQTTTGGREAVTVDVMSIWKSGPVMLGGTRQSAFSGSGTKGLGSRAPKPESNQGMQPLGHCRDRVAPTHCYHAVPRCITLYHAVPTLSCTNRDSIFLSQPEPTAHSLVKALTHLMPCCMYLQCGGSIKLCISRWDMLFPFFVTICRQEERASSLHRFYSYPA